MLLCSYIFFNFDPESSFFMSILLLLLFLLYVSLTLWLSYHWQRMPFFLPSAGFTTGAKVSLIIPVRNEAGNILSLLQDLDAQEWEIGRLCTPDVFEVIVVNDHSEDDTEALVNSFRPKHFALHLLKLYTPSGFSGSHKKLAISQAVAHASGEIIMTTDGDCRVGPRWIISMRQALLGKKAVMLSGPVTFYQEASPFEKLQTIEFASLVGTGAACMAAGKPNMCNGANLVFLKSAFVEVNGYEGSMHIPSGDDEFLLQKLKARYPGRIFFLKCAEAVVRTKPQPDLRSFYHQRKRWAGKWKLHKNPLTALLALFIFTFHLMLLLGAGMALAGRLDFRLMAALLLAKAVAELLLIFPVLRLMHKKLSMLNFLLLQLIYSAYAVFFGIVANFGGYRWKSRSYSHKTKPSQA